jgi:hypothetical protein
MKINNARLLPVLFMLAVFSANATPPQQAKPIIQKADSTVSKSAVPKAAATGLSDTANTSAAGITGNNISDTKAGLGLSFLSNPDAIFKSLWITLILAFALVVIWVLVSVIHNLTDSLKKAQGIPVEK